VAEVVVGRSNAEVARLRRRLVRTVANHLVAIFRKLGVGSRSELVARIAAEEIDSARYDSAALRDEMTRDNRARVRQYPVVNEIPSIPDRAPARGSRSLRLRPPSSAGSRPATRHISSREGIVIFQNTLHLYQCSNNREEST
jgi:hypothetical protein